MILDEYARSLPEPSLSLDEDGGFFRTFCERWQKWASRPEHEAPGIASQDEPFLLRRKTEQPDLMKLESGMKPWTVGTKDQLACACATDCLDEIVEAPNAGSIGKDIWVTNQLIDDLLMRAESIRKTSQVRNDECHVRILRREHVDDVRFACNIGEDWKPIPARSLAEFASWHVLVPVNLDAAKSEMTNGFPNHFVDAAGIAPAMHHGEASEALALPGDEAREFPVGCRVIGMKCRDNNRVIDSGGSRAAKIRFERRVGIPGRRHQVTTARMTVAVDNHPSRAVASRGSLLWLRPLFAPIAARNQMHVSIPPWNCDNENFSFGAWIRSSGNAKPIKTVGTPRTR
jgi:hypothetical protein